MARAISANEAQLRASGTELQGTNAELQMEVAERKRGEKELEESLSLLHATLESTVDGILVADPAGRIVKYNGKFAKMWGLNDENLAHWNEQQTVALLADQLEEDAGFLATARDLADQPDASTFDLLRFKDGRVFERHSHPQKIAGQSVGRVWCFRDITERITAELNLESAHRQLLESSRRAGMAEVATSVLHNVGNVLNSVNISCAVISEKLSRSRISAVKKMALLLEEQAGDLARFFTTDPKGQKLPAFLGKLSDQLLSEQALILQEVHSLGQNIEHIKNIVSQQLAG